MAAETRESRLAACVDSVRELCFRWLDEDDDGDVCKWDCAEAVLQVLAEHCAAEGS